MRNRRRPTGGASDVVRASSTIAYHPLRRVESSRQPTSPAAPDGATAERKAIPTISFRREVFIPSSWSRSAPRRHHGRPGVDDASDGSAAQTARRNQRKQELRDRKSTSLNSSH